VPATRRIRLLTLVATALGSALAFLDTTVVVVALPQMDADLDLGLAGQQWVYLAYALSLSAFYLVSGAVGDRVGLRRAFIVGVALFAAASAVCALAPTGNALIAGRALQGVGGAALTTTSLALLRVTWAGQAGRAIGLWTSLTSLATVGGPPLGGLIVDTVSWRWVFILNLPLAAVAVGLALASAGAGDRRPERAPLDLVGSGLAAIGLAGVTFAVVEAREQGVEIVLPAFAIGLAALAAFVVWTLRARSPLVPLSLLRRPGLARANVVTFALYGALGTQLLFLPVYVQFVGASPTVAGLVFVPPSVALVLLAPRFGRYADRSGPRRPIAGGAALISFSAMLLLPIDARGDIWTWGLSSLLLFAIGLSAVVAPITSAALSPAPDEQAGVASGLNQTVARIGGIAAVAVAGAVAGAVYVAAGGSAPTPFALDVSGDDIAAGVRAFRTIALSVAAMAALGSLLAAVLLQRPYPGESIDVLPGPVGASSS
jgi:EmrB/QacA subfamily drug resistance transporter